MICRISTAAVFLVALVVEANPMTDVLAKLIKSKLGESYDEEKVVKVIGAEKPVIHWDQNDSSIPTVNAGIVTTLTNKFFADYNSILMDVITENMNGLEIDDYCSEQGFGTLITGHMCVSNQKMLSYSVDKSRSKMEINSANNALKLRVSGVNMHFVLDYKVWSEPELIEEEGKGTFSISESDLDLQLMLTSKNGVLKVDFSEVKISMEEYNVTLDGTSDFSTVIELMLRNFKKFI